MLIFKTHNWIIVSADLHIAYLQHVTTSWSVYCWIQIWILILFLCFVQCFLYYNTGLGTWSYYVKENNTIHPFPISLNKCKESPKFVETMIHKTTISGTCPAGFCEYIQEYSVHLIVVLCIDIFIFFVTLVPPLFNWSTKKPDGKKRIYFAALACITFYFWLIFLAVNSLYCFGFMAHMGPCVNQTRFESSTKKSAQDDDLSPTISPTPLVISDDTIISTLSNDIPGESAQNLNDKRMSLTL